MRKLFTEPTMEIKSFAAENIVTGSAVQGNVTPDQDQLAAADYTLSVSATELGFVF